MPIVNAYFFFNYFAQANFFAVSWIGGHFAQKMKQQLVVSGPFLQNPDNFSGPKSNIQIEIKRIGAWVLASKILHFVSLTDSFIMLDAKLLKPLPCM